MDCFGRICIITFFGEEIEDPQLFNDVFQDISLLKGHILAFTPAEFFRQFVRGAKDAKNGEQ